MNIHRIAVALALANAVLLALLIAFVAQQGPVVSGDVIRAHALEIVDAQGRVRASLSVISADPSSTFEGRVYPETVLLRLIDPASGPDVKLSANERGGILVLGGGAQQTYAQFGADGTSGWVRLMGREGREQLIRP